MNFESRNSHLTSVNFDQLRHISTSLVKKQECTLVKYSK